MGWVKKCRQRENVKRQGWVRFEEGDILGRVKRHKMECKWNVG